MFTSIPRNRRRLADNVYDQILQAIRGGRITAHERIVQEKLAAAFRISRTPVREALFRMEQEGILELAGRDGFRIRQLDRAGILELYEARCAIEGRAAFLLARHPAPETCTTLRETIRQAEQIPDPSAQTYFNANRTIHRAMVAAAGNRFLLEMFDNIWNRGLSFTVFASIRAADLARSLGDHLALMDAVEQGPPELAARRMVGHIEDGLALQLESSSHPDPSDEKPDEPAGLAGPRRLP